MTAAQPSLMPACMLYVGSTRHRRVAPVEHAFRYRVFWLLLDVDRLDEAARASRWLSIDRFNLLGFHRRDHADGDGAPLRAWAERCFEEADVRLDGGAVRLLTFPRILGYAFKPLSIWFGYGPDGALRGVIYEVNNTFGDRHCYVAPASEVAAQEHAAEKVFHVSPFFEARGTYEFTLRPPGDAVSLGIRYSNGGKLVFAASQLGRARALTDANLLRAFFGQPLMTLKVIGGIHFEAFRLWRRGARYHPRPVPPALVSVAGPSADIRTIAEPAYQGSPKRLSVNK